MMESFTESDLTSFWSYPSPSSSVSASNTTPETSESTNQSTPSVSRFKPKTLQERLQDLVEGATPETSESTNQSTPSVSRFKPKTLQERLQDLVEGARENWTYAIFWQSSVLDYSASSILTWGDGYYEGEENPKTASSFSLSSAREQEHRKKVLLELNSLINGSSPSPDEVEDVTDAEWFFLVSMTESFANGSGLPGRAFFNWAPIWVAGAERLATSSCERARQGWVFGIQTMVCVPCANGVLELGSTDLVVQSLDMINMARAFV
ncbi:transcription factor MYC2-like [Cornus florida]|uniref:transcription factor MYC2-like n=1 Tax=Cornus florida TaxID=4283 RepID=UPI0028988CAB|nr:transcription factor MYC2-like [Cornus florida]